MICGQHGGVGGGYFIAMHAIGKPGYRRLVFDDGLCFVRRSLPGVSQALHAGFYVLDPVHVFRRRKHHVDQFPALPALRVFDDLHAVGRGLGERFEIANRIAMPGDPFAGGVTEYLLDRGNCRIVVVVGPEPEIVLGCRH